MIEYRVTFTEQERPRRHPTLALAHHEGWVAVLAPDLEAARAETLALLGSAWAFIYAPGTKGYPTEEVYPRGCLLRVVAGPSDRGPVALLSGPVPPHDPPPTHSNGYEGTPLRGELLVHVWPDGTGEVAWRPSPGGSWRPPARLDPAP